MISSDIRAAVSSVIKTHSSKIFNIIMSKINLRRKLKESASKAVDIYQKGRTMTGCCNAYLDKFIVQNLSFFPKTTLIIIKVHVLMQKDIIVVNSMLMNM